MVLKEVCALFTSKATAKQLQHWAGISNSSYYYQKRYGKPGRQASTTTLTTTGVEVNNEVVVQAIESILGIEFICYGYLPMTYELQERNYLINHKKVYRLMKENNLLCGATISVHAGKRTFVKYRKLQPSYPLQYLSMDIKYIKIEQEGKFGYVLSVIDVYSRAILAYIFKRSIKQYDVIWLFKKILNDTKVQGITIRNDNGSQFIAQSVRQYLKELGIAQEFAHVATPEDNAYIEAFHSIMEREFTSRYELETFGMAEIKIEQYMHTYNHIRKHGKIGYITPVQKLKQFYNEQTTSFTDDKPPIEAKPFQSTRFFEKEFFEKNEMTIEKNKKLFFKNSYNLVDSNGGLIFAYHNVNDEPINN